MQQYFQVTDADICHVFAHCLVHLEPHQRPCFFTKSWFFQLAKYFYESLNARAACRGMANWYSAATLRGSVDMHFAGTQPYNLAWRVSSLPKNAVVRGILLRGIRQQVSRMRRRKRLLFEDHAEPCTVLLGFCGTDGSLLDLLSPLSGEWWDPISTVLKPLLQDIQDTFMQAGYTAQEARPVLLA